MAWYKAGSVSVTNGLTTVTGSGTDWIVGVGIGEAFYGPDGRVYEIASITSATSLTLGSSYLGSNASGQAYQIIPTQSYIRDLAADASQLVASYASIASEAGTGKFGDGTQAAPGIRFTSNENTGIRRAGSNDMRLVSGGVDQASITSAGLSIQDAKLRITGSADATKVALFEVDGFTTGTTRTITLPNSDTTLPIASHVLTFSGPSAARTYTLPNSNSTLAALATEQTWTAKQTYQISSATTNAVTQAIRIDSQSTGTPANGIGVGMEFAAETTASNTEVGATIEAIVTDVTAASEDFDLVIKTMAAGVAASEGFRVKSTGGVTIPTGGSYQINGASVLSATELGSGVTGSSLTSFGTSPTLATPTITGLITTSFSSGYPATLGTDPDDVPSYAELGSAAYVDAETVVRTAAPITITTATHTVTTGVWIIVNFAGTCTLTLPNPAQFPGRNLSIKTITANTVISASSNIEPIDSATPGTAILAATAGKWARLVSDGIDWIIMEAN